MALLGRGAANGDLRGKGYLSVATSEGSRKGTVIETLGEKSSVYDGLPVAIPIKRTPPPVREGVRKQRKSLRMNRKPF